MRHAREMKQPTKIATLRKPTAEDGAAIWELIRECKPLDENSMYANLLQCDHFADTCVVAELDGEIVGWISGYLVPKDDALFVWQVAVSGKARGMGLGSQMLQHLWNRDDCSGVERMKTTITQDNEASWALFRKFAKKMNGELSSQAHFKENDHFAGQHSTEHMVSINVPVEMKKAA
ncbi:diaminobutyrate acetyltransferase [Poseidonocella pacifica]|uniref:L-2,4-diaminobutyric acid acetyltransferase n=1 Tax=Poseidonocella pacifica TaxID=871651 RepID=A0A1I0WRP6_9RHOB|nr:diaminobutyrate acetyltransferase [Poseidonocella pacifica]SFA90858.1 diaminobutyrate acetyltransferase [Poseidonocella pacifica]